MKGVPRWEKDITPWVRGVYHCALGLAMPDPARPGEDVEPAFAILRCFGAVRRLVVYEAIHQLAVPVRDGLDQAFRGAPGDVPELTQNLRHGGAGGRGRGVCLRVGRPLRRPMASLALV